MSLERKGEWDKDWVVLSGFFLFYSLHFIKQVFAYLYMYMYVYEHVWVVIFLLYCISCTYRKRKRKFTQKKISGKAQDLIELLPIACLPPEIKILSVLVKILWKAEIELSRSALIHMKTRVCGFFTGWASFQYGLRNFATYIPFYSRRMSIKMEPAPKKRQ